MRSLSSAIDDRNIVLELIASKYHDEAEALANLFESLSRQIREGLKR